MEVYTIPLLQDNYSYIVHDTSSDDAVVIDPVEPDKVLAAAQQHGVSISAVLTTHSHWDHAGGNNKFKQLMPSVTIYGGKGDNAEGTEVEVDESFELRVGAIVITALATPCHTPGHVTFVATCAGQPQAAFTGDTLFVGGCGNFNSGTPLEMYTALVTKICQLPEDTKLYVGHEYTVKNLQYAITVEPDNVALQQRLAWAQQQREQGQPTVPTTVKDELDTNPFVRCTQPSVQAYAGSKDPVETLATVRKRKTEWGRTAK
eukprot:TRINITY_DN8363_c0_g1_i2.p1 TRINITY_DN8363_c0_g1~~TRINITY_DN8363_c0_g1_i2.p1  ORF type:complete len:260 (+),score=53.73 TRINITY_DN8363_c0_g1_i2:136-915(+)